MNEKTSAKTSELSNIEDNTEDKQQTFLSKTARRAKSFANNVKPFVPAIVIGATAAFLFWRAAHILKTCNDGFDSEESED